MYCTKVRTYSSISTFPDEPTFSISFNKERKYRAETDNLYWNNPAHEPTIVKIWVFSFIGYNQTGPKHLWGISAARQGVTFYFRIWLWTRFARCSKWDIWNKRNTRRTSGVEVEEQATVLKSWDWGPALFRAIENIGIGATNRIDRHQITTYPPFSTTIL